LSGPPSRASISGVSFIISCKYLVFEYPKYFSNVSEDCDMTEVSEDIDYQQFFGNCLGRGRLPVFWVILFFNKSKNFKA